MSLRARLALAFVFLAVLPLAGITLYSYFASERAFRRAQEAEAGLLADEMRSRMDRVAEELGRRIENLREAPASRQMAEKGASPPDLTDQLLHRLETEMGEGANMVEALEFVPGPPPMPPPAGGPPPAAAPPGEEHARNMRDVARTVGLAIEHRLRGMDRTSGDRTQLADAIRREVEAATAEAGRASEEARRQAEAARRQAEEQRRSPEQAGPPPAPIPPPPSTGPSTSAGPSPPAAAGEGAAAAAADIARHTLAEIGRAAASRIAAAREERQNRARQTELLFGRNFGFVLRRGGEAVGSVRARVRAEQILESVLAGGRRRPDEIPFAIDADGHLHAPEEHRAALQKLGLMPAREGDDREMRRTLEDWVVVTRRDPGSGLTLGIARPIREPLKEIRRTAARNLLLGLAIVAVALIGILPVSRRITRDLSDLTAGAERLARGELETRVPVRSHDEVGRLAATFNRMAHDLRENQERLLEQERTRKELEMGRRIQEEMLPRDSLRIPFAEVKGVSIPAREVGGDFFNYFALPGGEAALLVGDVSGKGIAAALVMANLQATLRARLSVERDLARLAEALDHEVYSHEPLHTYLTLFMSLLDGEHRVMRYVNAGQNPPFLIRADGTTFGLEATGRPLGLLPGGGYEEGRVELRAGDCLFLYTDGVVECENEAGEPFGLQRLQTLFSEERTSGIDGLLARVEQAVRFYRGAAEPADDATMVVLRFGGAA